MEMGASQVVLLGSRLQMQETGDVGSIPGLGRSPGEGNGNSLQYSCMENLMDRRAWWAIVHGVTKSQTRLKRLSIYGNGDPPSPTCHLNTGNMGLSEVQQLKELLGSLRKADLRSMWE